MDCVNVRLLLTLSGRNLGELDPADRDALHGHLKTCPACTARAQADKAFDDVVGPAMLAVPIPFALKRDLLSRVKAHRKWRPVPWLAAAAALLLGIGAGGLWWSTNQPLTIDFPSFSQYTAFVSAESARDLQAADWFRERNLPFEFPHQLQADYLQSYDAVQYQGRTVPRLFFYAPADDTQRAAMGYVYVLHRDRFTLADANHTRQDFSAHTVQVLQSPEESKFIFVVIYPQGSRLDRLLVEAATQ